MNYISVIWDDSEGANVELIAEHGLSREEVEDVLLEPSNRFTRSASSGRPVVFGWTSTSRHIMVAFDEIDEMTVYPVTAYEVPER